MPRIPESTFAAAENCGTAAWIEVTENAGHDGTGMDAVLARDLVAFLVQAADELERLTGEAPPFM